MKKVLSVLLAAAMVMGMSVTSFAADWEWNGPTADTGLNADDIAIADAVVIERADGTIVKTASSAEAIDELEPGDDLYFPIDYSHVHTNACCNIPVHHVAGGVHDGATTLNLKDDCKASFTCKTGAYTGKIDEEWVIKSKSDKYVDSISFACYTGTAFSTSSTNMKKAYDKYVKVALVDELDATSDVEVDFTLYIKDDNKYTTNTVTFDGALMGNYGVKWLYADDSESIIDASYRTVWAADDKVEDIVFDFDNDVYFGVTMIKDEKVVLNLSTSYDKEIDKLFDDADLSFYNFQGSNDAFTKTGELFIPAEEETFIYEIVDGAIVEVEATYVTDEDILGMDIEDGWKIETKELGYYVVADEELVVAEEEVEAEVEADKANPETGAADFVGAAVAMAVVSVAAAGALALKK